MKTIQRFSTLAASLTLMLVAFEVQSKSGFEERFEECYGETLEVEFDLRAYDQAAAETVYLSLPKAIRWSVEFAPGDFMDKDGPCMPEPISVYQVRVNNLTAEERLGGEPEQTSFIKLTKRDGASNFDIFGLVRKRMASEGVNLEAGFRALPDHQITSFDGKGPVGAFSLPMSHQTPLGGEVLRSCGDFTCNSHYRIHPNIDALIQFRNETTYREWLDQEKKIQSFLGALIEKE